MLLLPSRESLLSTRVSENSCENGQKKPTGVGSSQRSTFSQPSLRIGTSAADTASVVHCFLWRDAHGLTSTSVLHLTVTGFRNSATFCTRRLVLGMCPYHLYRILTKGRNRPNAHLASNRFTSISAVRLRYDVSLPWRFVGHGGDADVPSHPARCCCISSVSARIRNPLADHVLESSLFLD